MSLSCCFFGYLPFRTSASCLSTFSLRVALLSEATQVFLALRSIEKLKAVGLDGETS